VPTQSPAAHLDEDLALASRLGDQLARFLRLVGRGHANFPEVYREGVEKVGYILLWHLVAEGPQRTTALAEAVHSDISTISRQVTALVRHGWVERRPDPDDGRACLLAVTDTGRRAFEDIRRRRDTHMARIMDGWRHEERGELARLVERLNDDMESYLRRGQSGCGSELNTRGEEGA
jgi:DNA-binding MarR family transcriptional regulator